MKYIIICIAAMLICFAIGYLIARIFVYRRKNTGRAGWIVLLTIINGLVIMTALTFAYLSIHYSAGEKAYMALAGNDKVLVEKIDGGYFFNGPSKSAAIVFYPGGKVECEAYAPLMLELAESGYDCFLADMPFNFSLFAGDRASEFMDHYQYDT